ncbi:acyltransferase [Sinorhizobium meliloti]|uniref:acyltransferase n=1 Tax=Rhizobium meliloti TaxID=382 RepID=UPI000FDC6C1C|nr:acyltransferase [Sinorhizobium meliloti]RVI06226.1 acyltransferase [Sinorhizobium meliloti]
MAPEIRSFGSAKVRVDKGENNAFEGTPPIGTGCWVHFEGSGAVLSFEPAVQLNEMIIVVRGNNCRLEIKRASRLTGRINLTNDHSRCIIGPGSSAERVWIIAGEGKTVSIGEDCMFAHGIEIRTSDAHSLVDRHTGQRINAPKDVTIEDHVWVGANVMINKGVTLPRDCIVAQGSVVTGKPFSEGDLIGGNPAKVLRQGCTWDRRLLPMPNEQSEPIFAEG